MLHSVEAQYDDYDVTGKPTTAVFTVRGSSESITNLVQQLRKEVSEGTVETTEDVQIS